MLRTSQYVMFSYYILMMMMINTTYTAIDIDDDD